MIIKLLSKFRAPNDPHVVIFSKKNIMDYGDDGDDDDDNANDDEKRQIHDE